MNRDGFRGWVIRWRCPYVLIDGFQSRNIPDMEEEIEKMTALTLGTGATSTSKHSKTKRRIGCKTKSPVQFDTLFLDQEDDENSDGHTRKKPRLSDEQVTLLESVFEEHCILDTALKQGLAKKLNIRPRQVEVWFQNKRARSKQKQTAADCENLKRRSEWLIKEKQKLKRELQKLASICQHDKTHSGLNLVTVCSSCNKIFRDHNREKL